MFWIWPVFSTLGGCIGVNTVRAIAFCFVLDGMVCRCDWVCWPLQWIYWELLFQNENKRTAFWMVCLRRWNISATVCISIAVILTDGNLFCGKNTLLEHQIWEIKPYDCDCVQVKRQYIYPMLISCCVRSKFCTQLCQKYLIIIIIPKKWGMGQHWCMEARRAAKIQSHDWMWARSVPLAHPNLGSHSEKKCNEVIFKSQIVHSEAFTLCSAGVTVIKCHILQICFQPVGEFVVMNMVIDRINSRH